MSLVKRPYLKDAYRYLIESINAMDLISYTREEWELLPLENRGFCIEWPGAREVKGYGYMKSKALGYHKIHRLAFELAFGSLTSNVLHHCDNPPCYRINHLFEGTQKENVLDMVSKGRGRVYDSNFISSSGMTLEKAEEMRSRYVPPPINGSNIYRGNAKELAEEYSIGLTQFHRIIKRECWV